MISAFGVEHGVVSKVLSPGVKQQRSDMIQRGAKQNRGIVGAGVVGTAGALIARKPKLAAGIAAATPAAVLGNAARVGPKYRKLGQPGAA